MTPQCSVDAALMFNLFVSASVSLLPPPLDPPSCCSHSRSVSRMIPLHQFCSLQFLCNNIQRTNQLLHQLNVAHLGVVTPAGVGWKDTSVSSLTVTVPLWDAFEESMHKLLVIDVTHSLAAGVQRAVLGQSNHVVHVLAHGLGTHDVCLNATMTEQLGGQRTHQSLPLVGRLAQLGQLLAVRDHHGNLLRLLVGGGHSGNLGLILHEPHAFGPLRLVGNGVCARVGPQGSRLRLVASQLVLVVASRRSIPVKVQVQPEFPCRLIQPILRDGLDALGGEPQAHPAVALLPIQTPPLQIYLLHALVADMGERDGTCLAVIRLAQQVADAPTLSLVGGSSVRRHRVVISLGHIHISQPRCRALEEGKSSQTDTCNRQEERHG
mmetsp:Transcript_21750/g.36819  ORF Transcript_21750/g.36819 Transcript_21750/m.36819 type:complete len:379 (+) Transcript_21750:306-1442(+)